MHVKCLLEISPFEEINEWCFIHKSDITLLDTVHQYHY